MILLYNVLIILLAPVWIPWMLIRSRRRAEKVNWDQRFGRLGLPKEKDPKRIWIHAVSVGEVVAATPILRALRKRMPDWEIILSVTTSSGHQTARDRFSELYDHLVYFPIDVPRFTVYALTEARPSAVAIMETELWLNFLWSARQIAARTMLVNGRISERSFRRSQWIKPFYRAVLGQLDQALMQSDGDSNRIRALGMESPITFGNCKFDEGAAGLEADRTEWRQAIGAKEGDLVLVIGSTRSEEEEAWVMDAVAPWMEKGLRVVHAPRHLERASALLTEAKRRFGDAGLRSEGSLSSYLVLDTYGELSKVYAAADAVVIGGGFSDLGGQNLIQPLAHGKPVIHGPHMQNFRDAAQMAKEAGAAVTAIGQELGEALTLLLENPQRREAMGNAAKELVQRQLGASERYAEAIAAAAEAAREEKLSRRANRGK